MSMYVDLSNPKIFHNGRDKYGNGIYHIPPDLPTDDAVERKKGEWILKPNIYGVAYCSECDYELHTNNTNYCPNCGARMDAERKEECTQ